MKTRGLILFAAFFASAGFLQGQDLLLTFSGTGTSVDSVRIENLASGEKVIAGGNQVLRLIRIISGVEKSGIDAGQEVTFSPNPMNEYSVMEFTIPLPAETVISIIDLAGKEILKLNENLGAGHHSYRLSGIKGGINFVIVRSAGYTLTGTLVSVSTQGNANAKYMNTMSFKESGKVSRELKKEEPEKRGSSSEVSMQYIYGDSLKFTASSGNYRKVIFDVPDMSKTVTFDFFECTDGDNNNYPWVKIGNYVWMAENLRTATFNDGTPIRYVSDDSTWAKLSLSGMPAFSWYNNDEGNRNVYGGLYNIGVVSGAAAGKNVCPTGWHVAAGEWDDLFSYLDSAAAPDGEVSKTAGNLIKEGGNMHWVCTDNKATNQTGFTALPGGIRKPGFEHLGDRAYFWDGTVGKFILYCTSGVVGHLSETIDYGLSVRCVKNSGFYITFKGTGAATAVSDVTVENLTTGASVVLKGNQTLYLGQDKGPAETVFMEYSAGQKLKFTGISGDYSTVMVDKIAGDRTVTFNFIRCMDGDGNSYPVVKIGEYTWMAENLKTTKYKDGTPITYLVDWGSGGYRLYNDDPGYKDTYGALYTETAFKSGMLCPVGWHAPNNSEWGYITDFLGGPLEAGGRLKETGTAHWAGPNTGATNESGFTALPGGYMDHVLFNGIGTSAYFWSLSKCGGTSDCGWGIGFNQNSISWSDRNTSVGYSVRCVYGEEPMIPELETLHGTQYVNATELLGLYYYVKNDHGLPVTQEGLCWSTTPLPTINDPHTSNGIILITGLTPGTKYYVRAYATNSAGTGYSLGSSFVTLNVEEPKKADVEGNIYDIIKIGSQVWMKPSLHTRKLNDGTNIQLITDDDLAWWNSVTPAYCDYPKEWGYNGLIYNWQSANSGKLCPAGWHVPSDADWTVLTNYLIANGFNYDGTVEGNKISKALAYSCCWKSSDLPGTPGNSDYPEKIDASGFSALPGGTRGLEFSPDYNEIAVFWSSTPRHSTGDYYVVSYNGVSGFLTGPDSGDKQGGFAVRCLKDY